jgi:hypothetical protein
MACGLVDHAGNQEPDEQMIAGYNYFLILNYLK